MFEIERKFLIESYDTFTPDKVIDIKQGYLCQNGNGVTRIRKYGNEYILTIKMKDEGLRQIEIEKDLSKEEFDLLWTKIDKSIEKTRYIIGRWEIDVFHNLTDKYENLILAEIEIESEDEVIDIPKWVKIEVTGLPEYFNSNLINYCK